MIATHRGDDGDARRHARARPLRPRRPRRCAPVDVNALADAVVEELRALGHDVTFARRRAPDRRGPAQSAAPGGAQPDRQCASNMAARREVAVRGGGRLDRDRGRRPAVRASPKPSSAMCRSRSSASKPRATARPAAPASASRWRARAAQAHGGRLELENRPGGGLLGADPAGNLASRHLRREALHLALAAPQFERLGAFDGRRRCAPHRHRRPPRSPRSRRTVRRGRPANKACNSPRVPPPSLRYESERRANCATNAAETT